jgi:ATP-dependent Clp protease protease subunit
MLKNRNRNLSPKNIAPLIFEKTKDGEILYDVYSRLQKERIIFLSEEIDADVGTSIAATLLWLDHQNNKDISLYINTNGGTVSDGLFTIYDTMQYIKSPIQTVVIGEAYSAGAVILAAGSPGKRMAFPNAEIMLHEVQSEIGGSGSEIAKQSNRLQRMGDILYEIVARHTGQTVDKIKDDCSEDFFLTAKEALAYGIIDKIVKPSKELIPLKTKKRVKRA